MFSQNKINSYAKLLGLTSDELDEFMRRYKTYLISKDKITKNILINGLFILDDIHAMKWADEANKTKYKTKNVIIIKYLDEIIDLYQGGMGSSRITKSLKLNHRVVVSKSAIDRFIVSNKLKRS